MRGDDKSRGSTPHWGKRLALPAPLALCKWPRSQEKAGKGAKFSSLRMSLMLINEGQEETFLLGSLPHNFRVSVSCTFL